MYVRARAAAAFLDADCPLGSGGWAEPPQYLRAYLAPPGASRDRTFEGGDPPGLSRIRGSLGPEGLRPPFYGYFRLFWAF
jgi:hypothetical protein